MRTAPILLALVVVLGFVREAEAWEEERPPRNYPMESYLLMIGEMAFGFIDHDGTEARPDTPGTAVCLGPFGNYDVPFTATQGLVGFCLILATLIIVPVVCTVRWIKKRAAK